ncbi:GTP-binding protein [Gulosibacter sp. 10]|uniref:CobW family GTP-binding protein n=1 Tax=Gulosibacter sp. 10 TaxID=1255570 RepID=UPI00097F4887|nr:GTP-binding protein [Gulosibacter sp. 10]SJM61010.1 Putative metal chaperone, involved in Zn homeostasis, GTPase of COG0523 family [Gulosibacter sp. 10]
MTPDASVPARVPVIAITGYLGAGKTTVLNHLLRAPGARLGVIVNDFGELDVDAASVAGRADEIASIAGGCICCLPEAGGLDEALERLAQPEHRVDAILVEASGAADPMTLAQLIRFSGAERIRPGGVIEIIDAVEHFHTVDTGRVPPERYDAASLVVIAKSDRIPRSADRAKVVNRIIERVRMRNPHAQCITAHLGRIDPSLIFDAPLPSSSAGPGRDAPTEAHSTHAEHPGVAAVARATPGAISPTALIDLLEHPPPGTYRLKGRVRIRWPRADRGYLVNLVGRAIHIAPLDRPPRRGELVLIGTGLDTGIGEARLDAALQSPAIRPDARGLRRLRRYRLLSE